MGDKERRGDNLAWIKSRLLVYSNKFHLFIRYEYLIIIHFDIFPLKRIPHKF